MAVRKKFFEVEVPLTNSHVDILAYSIGEINNRNVKLDLTRQLRGKSIEVVFKIEVEKDKATASPTKLTLLPYFIKRMLRKNISYVEDSFSIDCKNAQIRIKPFLITRKKVSRKVRKALRENTKEWLEDYVKNKNYQEIFSDIIANRLQKPLSLKLKKIYPLALCEIRVMALEKLKEQEKLKVTVEKIKKSEETDKKTEKVEEKTEEENKKEEKPSEEPKTTKKTEKKISKKE